MNDNPDIHNRLIDRLSVVTDEEKEYLAGKRNIEKSKYFINTQSSIVSAGKLFPEENRDKKQIEIRTHTRFIDFPEHGHDYIEMMYVCRGNITHYIDGREIILREGGILLMNRHVKHSIKRAELNDIGINFIISPLLFEYAVSGIKENDIFTDFLIENLRNNGSPVYLQFDAHGVLPIENVMENLLYSLINNRCAEPHILQKATSLLFTYFVSFPEILVNRSVASDYVESMKIAIDSYIKSNYRDGNLSQIASKLGMSHSYLSKWISANMHMNFKEMLVEQRFKVAEYLLKTTDLSVTDVADAVGYENESYFYRQFKKRFNLTPKEVRKKNGTVQKAGDII